MNGASGWSRLYLILLGIAAAAGGGIAAVSDNLDMGFAAAIVGLYFLHLYSVRDMHEQWQKLRGIEHVMAELGFAPDEVDRAARPAGASPTVPEPRGGADRASGDAATGGFAPGTVALIEGLMTPEEVSRTLTIQQEEPGRPFGEVALELGFLSPEERDGLERSREEGDFVPERIERARRSLRSYRDELRART